jgi:type II secretory pathway component PulJ
MSLAMAIGVFVISQTLSLYSEKLANQNFQISQLRLNQEVRAITNMIVGDIKRHAFWAGSDITANPHTRIVVESNCIIVSYDRNQDASTTPANNEVIGYRLRQGKIQTRNNTNNCNEGRWESLNEVEFVAIDQFQFSNLNKRRCINLSHSPVTSCDPNRCDYHAYTSGDRLLYSLSMDLSLGATLTHEADLNIQIKQQINLPNPIVETVQSAGPLTTTRTDCA